MVVPVGIINNYELCRETVQKDTWEYGFCMRFWTWHHQSLMSANTFESQCDSYAVKHNTFAQIKPLGSWGRVPPVNCVDNEIWEGGGINMSVGLIATLALNLAMVVMPRPAMPRPRPCHVQAPAKPKLRPSPGQAPARPPSGLVFFYFGRQWKSLCGKSIAASE